MIKSHRLVVYLFCLLVALPFFSSEIGIAISGGKVSIVDFIVFSYLFFFLANINKTYRLLNINPEMKWWILFLLMCLIMIPVGIINGGSFGECIRLIRNLLYMPVTFLLLIRYNKNGEEDEAVIFVSLIVAINTIVNAIVLYKQHNWFQFYRANGVLCVFLFCYLVFRIIDSSDIKKQMKELICIILLLVAMFFSQERTQLLTAGISLAVTFLLRSIKCAKSHSSRYVPAKKIVFVMLCIVISVILFCFIVQIDVVKKYIAYYYTYRLGKGGVLKISGMTSDSSAQARVIQLKTILKNNMNPFYFLLGRGTCSYYLARQGMTYIVDSAFLWSFKDLGLIGFIILTIFVTNMMNIFPKCKCYYSLFASGLSLVVFMAYNPSFLLSQNVNFAIGLFAFLKNIQKQKDARYNKSESIN